MAYVPYIRRVIGALMIIYSAAFVIAEALIVAGLA